MEGQVYFLLKGRFLVRYGIGKASAPKTTKLENRTENLQTPLY